MQRTSVIQPTTIENPHLLEDDGSNDSIWIVARKMLFFTLLMTIAPLGSFFLSKDYVFQGFFNVSYASSYTYAAIVAVIVVHIVLISFLFVAFREDIPMKKTALERSKESAGKKD